MHTEAVVTVPPDAAGRDALLDRLSTLGSVRHACLEAVTPTGPHRDGGLGVTRDGGAATDLATVLSVRSRLEPPEAATVAASVAQALAALHSAGAVHGPLAPRDVVVDPSGQVLLRPRLAPPEGRWAAADDVAAVARLVTTVVGRASGDDAVALGAALAQALVADARVRPEAGTLAARVHDAVPPEPVRLPEPAALAAAALAGRPPRALEGPPVRQHRRARLAVTAPARSRRPPGRSTRRRSRAGRPGPRVVVPRGVLLPLGALGATAVLAAGGLALSQPGPPAPGEATIAERAEGPAGQAAPPHGAPAGSDDATADLADPAGAAVELTRRRAELVAGTRGVADIAAPGSAAHDLDADTAARAAASGSELRGAEVIVHRAHASEHGDGVAQVEVRYVVGAHQQVGHDGRVTEVPASGPRSATLVLVWTAAGWRVSEVA